MLGHVHLSSLFPAHGMYSCTTLCVMQAARRFFLAPLLLPPLHSSQVREAACFLAQLPTKALHLCIMLVIYLLSCLLLSHAFGVPLEPFGSTWSETSVFEPFHGPYSAYIASRPATGEPTITYVVKPTPYPAATTTDVDEPSATDKGGYVQTSMPTTGVKGVGAARMSTGERAQAIAGAAGLGECPTTTIGKPKCYRYAWEFPPKSAWVSLDCLISHARPRMVTSSNDGPNEADNAIAAVKSVAGQAGIDPYVFCPRA